MANEPFSAKTKYEPIQTEKGIVWTPVKHGGYDLPTGATVRPPATTIIEEPHPIAKGHTKVLVLSQEELGGKTNVVATGSKQFNPDNLQETQIMHYKHGGTERTTTQYIRNQDYVPPTTTLTTTFIPTQLNVNLGNALMNNEHLTSTDTSQFTTTWHQPAEFAGATLVADVQNYWNQPASIMITEAKEQPIPLDVQLTTDLTQFGKNVIASPEYEYQPTTLVGAASVLGTEAARDIINIPVGMGIALLGTPRFVYNVVTNPIGTGKDFIAPGAFSDIMQPGGFGRFTGMVLLPDVLGRSFNAVSKFNEPFITDVVSDYKGILKYEETKVGTNIEELRGNLLSASKVSYSTPVRKFIGLADKEMTIGATSNFKVLENAKGKGFVADVSRTFEKDSTGKPISANPKKLAGFGEFVKLSDSEGTAVGTKYGVRASSSFMPTEPEGVGLAAFVSEVTGEKVELGVRTTMTSDTGGLIKMPGARASKFSGTGEIVDITKQQRAIESIKLNEAVKTNLPADVEPMWSKTEPLNEQNAGTLTSQITKDLQTSAVEARGASAMRQEAGILASSSAIIELPKTPTLRLPGSASLISVGSGEMHKTSTKLGTGIINGLVQQMRSAQKGYEDTGSEFKSLTRIAPITMPRPATRTLSGLQERQLQRQAQEQLQELTQEQATRTIPTVPRPILTTFPFLKSSGESIGAKKRRKAKFNLGNIKGSMRSIKVSKGMGLFSEGFSKSLFGKATVGKQGTKWNTTKQLQRAGLTPGKILAAGGIGAFKFKKK